MTYDEALAKALDAYAASEPLSHATRTIFSEGFIRGWDAKYESMNEIEDTRYKRRTALDAAALDLAHTEIEYWKNKYLSTL